MFGRFRRTDPVTEYAAALNTAIVTRAREPAFYTQLGVADTIDGRFDLLAVHAFLVMDALKRRGAPGAAVSTALATAIFTGLEEGLRDLGIGDIGLGRRMKAMANAFYGRLETYGAAETEEQVGNALIRNVYRGVAVRRAEAIALARYMLAIRRRWSAPGAAAAIVEGRADFGPLPESRS